MNTIEAKIFSLATLGVGTVIVGLLPAWFTNQGRRQWPLLLSCLLCLGGGVLLATSVVHILPELRVGFPVEFQSYSELIFCAGFFLLYAMDEIVHYFYKEPSEEDMLGQRNHPSSNGRRHSTSSKYTYGATEKTGLMRGEKSPPYNPSFFRARSDSVLFCEEATPSQLCHVGHQEPCHTVAPIADIGLLVALSIHALLEGLVVGLEESSSKVLLLLGAIASHKLVVGFCLGVELASNFSTTLCRHFTCILIFALGSLTGICVGMLILNVPSSVNDLVIPIFQGLAGGTLLYVAVSEVIPRERARWHQLHDKKAAGVYQFASVALGFLLTSVLSKYLDHE